MIKKILDKITSAAEDEQKIVLIDPSSLAGGSPEPDLRIIGMFCDVHEEKVAEIIHAMLYLNEMNRLAKNLKAKSLSSFTFQLMVVVQTTCSHFMMLCEECDKTQRYTL